MAFGLLGNKGMHASNGNTAASNKLLDDNFNKMSLLRNEVFVAPKALDDSSFFSLTGYIINTNGLKDTPITNEDGTASGSIRHKARILAAALKSCKADVGLITETHDHSLKSDKRFSEFKLTESVPLGGKHGTATVINSGTYKTLKEVTLKNLSATLIASNANEEIWVVAAYFPNIYVCSFCPPCIGLLLINPLVFV
jgi:hypothetical protein